MDKMSYQQARYIRNHSLANLLAGELSSGEGFGKSVKKVVGLKTKAKITGIKEKIDPLNIIKMLTFGSNLAPALLGRILGRSQKDIQNFAGRSRLVGDKATKVGKLPSQEDTSGLTETLHKIYSFMKKSQEHDTLMREKTNNFREQKQLEDDRRNKELIKALGATGTSTKVTKDKKPGGGLLDGLISAFDGLMDWVKDLLSPILKIWNDVSEFFSGKLWRTLLTAGEWLIKALLSPEALIAALIGAGLIATVLAGQALAEKLEKYQEDKAREQGGEPAVQALKKQRESIDHTQDSMGVVQNEDLDNATDEKEIAIKRKQDLIAQFMAKEGYSRWQGFWDRHTGKYTFAKGTKSDGDPPPPELLKKANDYADSIVNAGPITGVSTEAAQKSRSDFAAQDPRRTDSKSENVTPTTTTATATDTSTPVTPTTTTATATDTSKPTTSATEMSPTPPSSAVTPASRENQMLQLQAQASSSSSSTVTNNVVSSSVSKPQNNTVGIDIPAVRNTEDTFRRLSINSTRLV